MNLNRRFRFTAVVELFEQRSETSRLHSDNRIRLRIEGLRTSENVYCNGVRLDRPLFAGERLRNHVTQQFGELGRTGNPLPAKEFVQGGLHLLRARCDPGYGSDPFFATL